MSIWGDEGKRTAPTKVLKTLVYRRDKGVCRLCSLPVDPLDFDIGHDLAFAKGGKLNLQNAILLHPSCNRSMRTLKVKEARKVLGMPETHEEVAKKVLNTLSMAQLKYLAKEHYVKLKSKVERGFFSETVVRPTKRQYVNALSKTLTADEVKQKIAKMPKPVKKKRRKAKKKSSFW